jgi:hypothetical protein
VAIKGAIAPSIGLVEPVLRSADLTLSIDRYFPFAPGREAILKELKQVLLKIRN